MWESARDVVDRLLGLELPAAELTLAQMTARTVVVFCFAVLLFRLADRRFLGRNAGYDVTLGVVLGSVLSRAINGTAAFGPTLGASAALVLLHHLLSTLAYHSHWWSRLLKGEPRTLVTNGKIDRHEQRRNKITDEDLDENLRLHGQEIGTDNIREARIERNGEVSVVKSFQPSESAGTEVDRSNDGRHQFS